MIAQFPFSAPYLGYCAPLAGHWSVLLSFFVSALMGVIFGLVPAYKASQLDPIAALRYEEPSFVGI